MIENLFQKSKPTFISIQGENFVIGEKKVQAIDGFIHDLQPLRKFFYTGKLLCYSYDNTTGKDGKYCAFCRDQFRCQKRLRLMILVIKVEKEPHPAILEINQFSFENFEYILNQIDPKDLPNTQLRIQIVKDTKERKNIKFQFA